MITAWGGGGYVRLNRFARRDAGKSWLFPALKPPARFEEHFAGEWICQLNGLCFRRGSNPHSVAHGKHRARIPAIGVVVAVEDPRHFLRLAFRKPILGRIFSLREGPHVILYNIPGQRRPTAGPDAAIVVCGHWAAMWSRFGVFAWAMALPSRLSLTPQPSNTTSTNGFIIQ